jgi:hypothetical protein
LFAGHIANFDLNAIANGQFDYSPFLGWHPADSGIISRFIAATEELVKILQKRTTHPTGSRPPTPIRRTILPDPKYSDGSVQSIESLDSTDSKGEHYTQQYVYTFVNATLAALQNEIGEIPWISSRLSKFNLRHFPISSKLIIVQSRA